MTMQKLLQDRLPQEWQVLSPCCVHGYSVKEHELDDCPNGYKVWSQQDAKPAVNTSMGTNVKNPALIKTAKKEKE